MTHTLLSRYAGEASDSPSLGDCYNIKSLPVHRTGTASVRISGVEPDRSGRVFGGPWLHLPQRTD